MLAGLSKYGLILFHGLTFSYSLSRSVTVFIYNLFIYSIDDDLVYVFVSAESLSIILKPNVT